MPRIRKTWILTDPHFKHPMLVESGSRPADYEAQIVNNWNRMVFPGDVVICLGDVCFGSSVAIHEMIRGLPGRKWLVKGNHDNETDNWYLNYWDVVCENLTIVKYAARWLFSHAPVKALGQFDFNIHGHLHDGKRRLAAVQDILTPNHILMALEYDGYAPVDFERIKLKIDQRPWRSTHEGKNS